MSKKPIPLNAAALFFLSFFFSSWVHIVLATRTAAVLTPTESPSPGHNQACRLWLQKITTKGHRLQSHLRQGRRGRLAAAQQLTKKEIKVFKNPFFFTSARRHGAWDGNSNGKEIRGAFSGWRPRWQQLKAPSDVLKWAVIGATPLRSSRARRTCPRISIRDRPTWCLRVSLSRGCGTRWVHPGGGAGNKSVFLGRGDPGQKRREPSAHVRRGDDTRGTGPKFRRIESNLPAETTEAKKPKAANPVRSWQDGRMWIISPSKNLQKPPTKTCWWNNKQINWGGTKKDSEDTTAEQLKMQITSKYSRIREKQQINGKRTENVVIKWIFSG